MCQYYSISMVHFEIVVVQTFHPLFLSFSLSQSLVLCLESLERERERKREKTVPRGTQDQVFVHRSLKRNKS